MFPCSVSVHPVNLGELDLPTPFSLRSPRKSRSTGLERKHVMRTTLAAVTALAGSLLLPCLMLGSAKAVTSAPDLKNVISTTDNGTINGTITPVRGGGGGFAGGGGHMEGAGFGSHMAVVISVAWVAIWVVLPVAPSMVDPDLPVGSSIMVTSMIGTS